MISILGPRQSGKTTLAKKLFPNYVYVNLENPDTRAVAQNDPRGFLSKYRQKIIIDEIQRVPHLFSYLQEIVDTDKISQQFILTGSQHFLLLDIIPQTLAGRMAVFNLNPLSNDELEMNNRLAKSWPDQILKGHYPALYHPKTDRSIWFAGYLATYLDRDVRLISQVDNLPLFERFLRMLAGRTSQLLNLTSIGNDLGISHNTAKAWVSLLETSGLVFLLQPYYANLTKRLVKTPKLYFTDTGLVCWLLGIQNQEQLQSHPLIGALFETLMVNEYHKHVANFVLPWQLYFYRDHKGLEADLVVDRAGKLELIEIKAQQTLNSDFLVPTKKIKNGLKGVAQCTGIYGGKEDYSTLNGPVNSWQKLNLGK